MICVFSIMPYGNISSGLVAGLKNKHKDLSVVGGNSGNLLFSLAGTMLSGEEHVFINHRFSIEMIRTITAKCKGLILPIANILSDKIPVNSNYTSKLEAVQCPIIVMGLGLQANLNKQIKDIELPNATVRFLKVLSNKSALVVTRGPSTLELCSKYIKTENFAPLGCPSILLAKEKNLGEILSVKMRKIIKNIDNDKFLEPRSYTVGNILKFKKNLKEDKSLQINIDFERFLLSDSLKCKNASIIFQTESNLFDAFNQYINNQDIDLSIFKAFNLEKELISSIEKDITNNWRSRFKHYISAKDWIRSITKNKISFSSRIHGTIAPLMAKVPAICFYHDARTKELSNTLNIPNVNIESTKNIDSFILKNLILKSLEKFNPDDFDNHRSKYSQKILKCFNSLDIKTSSHILNLI